MGWRDGLESLGRGAANTLTGGLNDELIGRILSSDLVNKLQDDGTGIPREYAGGQYEQYRDQQRADEAASKAANPKLFMGGQLAGTLPATVALPGSGLAGIGAGAARGLVQGFGDSTKSGLGLAGDTALGGVVGAGATKGAQLLGKGLSKLGKAAGPAMQRLLQSGPPKSAPAPAPKVPAAFTKPTVPAPPGPLPAAAARPSITPTSPAPPMPTLRPTLPAPSMRPTSPAPAPSPPVPKLPPRPQPSILKPREPTLEAKLDTAYNAPNAAALRPRTSAEEAVVMQELAKMPNLRQAALPVRNMVTGSDDILAMPGSAPFQSTPPSQPPIPLSAFKGSKPPVDLPPARPTGQPMLPPPPPVQAVPRAAPMRPPPPGPQIFGEYSFPPASGAPAQAMPQPSPSALEKAVEEYLKKQGGG